MQRHDEIYKYKVPVRCPHNVTFNLKSQHCQLPFNIGVGMGTMPGKGTLGPRTF